ncbi:MAG: hypothetical protein ACC653_04725 [Gammaproteobacteria bacterium]
MKNIKYSSLVLFYILNFISGYSYSGEMLDRENIKLLAHTYYENKQFDLIEKMAEKFRTNKERTSSGLWKLTIFYISFNDNITPRKQKVENYWENKHKIIDSWIKQYPKSPTAHILKAGLYSGQAWFYRGNSYASKVDPRAWKPYKEYINKAIDYLNKYKDIASIDPQWYDTMAGMYSNIGISDKRYFELINEGLDREPEFYELYFTVIYYLAPKWHGDKKRIEDFARFAVKRTHKTDGMQMYARIYWAVSQNVFKNDLFNKSLVNWEDMRTGIYEVLNKYPDQWNINNFANFACQAGDKKTTKDLMSMIVGEPILTAWSDYDNYNTCKTLNTNQKDKGKGYR